MDFDRRQAFGLLAGTAAASALGWRPTAAATPADMLVLVNEMDPNSLDTMLRAPTTRPGWSPGTSTTGW